MAGPRSPLAAASINSIVTSFSTATISWSVSRVAYTPETYTVVYGTNQINLDQRSTSVSGVTGVSGYSIELTQLQHGTVYYFQVESTNSIGTTRSGIRSFEVQNACKFHIHRLQNYFTLMVILYSCNHFHNWQWQFSGCWEHFHSHMLCSWACGSFRGHHCHLARRWRTEYNIWGWLHHNKAKQDSESGLQSPVQSTEGVTWWTIYVHCVDSKRWLSRL